MVVKSTFMVFGATYLYARFQAMDQGFVPNREACHQHALVRRVNQLVDSETD